MKLLSPLWYAVATSAAAVSGVVYVTEVLQLCEANFTLPVA